MTNNLPKIARFDAKWTIKNISLWNSECHGSCFKMPVNKDVWFDMILFPKGVNSTQERLTVHWVAARCAPNGRCTIKLVYYGSDGFPLGRDEVVNIEVKKGEPIELPSGPKFVDVIKTRNDSLVLHCILLVGYKEYSTVFLKVFSSINVTNYSVKLMKDKFKNLGMNRNHILFNFKLSNSPFEFLINFNGNNLEESLSFFKITMQQSIKKYFLKCVVALESEINYSIAKQVEYFQFFGISENTQSWALPTFLSRKELLQGVALHVHFKVSESDLYESSFSCSVDDSENVLPTSLNNSFIAQNQTEELDINPNRSQELKDNLLSDFSSMYKDQNFSDFEIRCGETSFPVHKTVLIARSPVLKTMFTTNMKEVESGIMEIPDADVHTMGRFLTFLYSADLDDLQWENAIKLYDMADKYEVLLLREACSSILHSSLSVSNAGDILLFADLHSDEKLKNAVQDFIINNLECVIGSDEWKNCLRKHPLLFGETLTYVCNQKFVIRN